MTELASAGDVTIPKTAPPQAPRGTKRNRDSVDDSTSLSLPTSPSRPLHNIADARRVSSHSPKAVSQSPPAAMTPESEPALFSLPMYSNELGRLPVYGQFNFSDSVGTRMPVETPNFDQFLSYLSTAPQNVPSQSDPANVLNGPFSSTGAGTGQHMSDVPHYQGQQFPSSVDFSTLFNTPMDVGAWSRNMPAMDNDTMNMWSMAPTNLE